MAWTRTWQCSAIWRLFNHGTLGFNLLQQTCQQIQPDAHRSQHGTLQGNLSVWIHPGRGQESLERVQSDFPDSSGQNVFYFISEIHRRLQSRSSSRNLLDFVLFPFCLLHTALFLKWQRNKAVLLPGPLWSQASGWLGRRDSFEQSKPLISKANEWRMEGIEHRWNWLIGGFPKLHSTPRRGWGSLV